MYDEILLPVDGSDISDKSINKAIQLSKLFDANLHIIYVVTPIEYNPVHREMTTRGTSEMKEKGESVISNATEKVESNGLTPLTKILLGKPYEEIGRYADSNNIDLIVMGTHGFSGIRRVLFGSTTELVIRETDCEVLSLK